MNGLVSEFVCCLVHTCVVMCPCVAYDIPVPYIYILLPVWLSLTVKNSLCVSLAPTDSHSRWLSVIPNLSISIYLAAWRLMCCAKWHFCTLMHLITWRDGWKAVAASPESQIPPRPQPANTTPLNKHTCANNPDIQSNVIIGLIWKPQAQGRYRR